MIQLIIWLILAHILGDYPFKPNSWVEDKRLRKWRSVKGIYHAIVHFLLVFVLFPVSLTNRFLIASVVAITHWLIDGLKASKPDNFKWWLIDQSLHMLVMLIAFLIYIGPSSAFKINWVEIFSVSSLIILLAYMIAYWPVSHFIKRAIRFWSSQIPESTQGLKKAGKWIGRLKRVLILTFIFSNQFGAIGFLLATKSVFRFGDLTDKHAQGKTEYILLGTLLSFSITVILGIGATLALQYFDPGK